MDETGQTNMLERWGPVALGVVGIVIAIAYSLEGWSSLSYKQDAFQTFLQVLGSLFVVALFLERALAVINDLIFGRDRAIADAAVKAAIVRTSAARASLLGAAEDSGAYKIAADNVSTQVIGLSAAIKMQELVNERRQRLRLGVAFIIAVLIAAVGVRTLGALVDDPLARAVTLKARESIEATISAVPATAPNRAELVTSAANKVIATLIAPKPNGRSKLFDWLDILLTAGLLAGGSNGIARMIERIRDPKPDPTEPPTDERFSFKRFTA